MRNAPRADSHVGNGEWWASTWISKCQMSCFAPASAAAAAEAGASDEQGECFMGAMWADEDGATCKWAEGGSEIFVNS
jgi:hypothetical protein